MMNEAVADLAWLSERGALAGVAEIIRERRRQVEQLGWTPEYDRREHVNGWMMREVAGHAARAEHAYGLGGCQVEMTQAGALAAAEIDRLAAGSGG